MPDRSRVVILGAGVCGLYAARVLARRGVPVTVLEKEALPGGLAAGQERNGNYYDLGVHLLHAFDREIFEDIRSILGPRLMPVELRALVQYGDGFRRYPLELADMLKSIPSRRLLGMLGGLGIQTLKNMLSRVPAADAEEALIRLYGRPLYEHFFKEFTHRYWGRPPHELSAGFVKTKMPRLSAVDIVKDALAKIGIRTPEQAVNPAMSRETLWYTSTGAREISLGLAERVREDGGEILLSCPVTSVELESDRVAAVSYVWNGDTLRIPCEFCLSTIPIPDLLRGMSPAPPAEILDAAAHLRYRPIATYGLLVRKKRAIDPLYIYFRRRLFHRVAEPRNCGLMVTPEGHTILLAEVTCDEGDDRWNGGEETRRRILSELEEEGIVRPDEVVEVHPLRVRHAYPVFALGFERHHEKIKNYLSGIGNLQSTGRQGAFNYPNMHGAMRMGADAAAQILQSGFFAEIRG